jgi:hypothetical protein
MSEYRYFEFQAIDRPLNAREMATLRSYSTRARITPTSFINEYHWGDFKGDPDAWMAKYFDAFLYLTNWGIRIFKLRLPSRLIPPDATRPYCDGEVFTVRRTGAHCVLTYDLEEEAGGDWEEGDGQLAALVAVRAELARGDLRALYLGWLLGVQLDASGPDVPEPPVPPGLGELSASLDSLIEFLHIDRDLVAVAAERSAPLAEITPDAVEIAAWLAAQPAGLKDEWLARVVMGADPALPAELLNRYLKESTRQATPVAELNSPRTPGDLLHLAEARSHKRAQIAAEKAAREKARGASEAAAARAKHLDSLAGREPQLWLKIADLVATRLPKEYDEAVRLLLDLRDLAPRDDPSAFQSQLDGLRTAHARKPSLIARLKDAGL